MRRILLLFIFISVVFCGYSQSFEQISYLDSNFTVCERENAMYKREAVAKDGDYFAVIYKLNGNYKFMEGFYLDNELTMMNGKWKYFFESGRIKGYGRFKDGIRIGRWRWFDEFGHLEAKYKYYKDGSFKRILDY